MPPVQPARPPRTLPLPLFIGLIAGFYGTAALTAAFAIGKGYENVERWSLFNTGCDVAAGTLIAYSLFAIANRLYGSHRVLMQVSAWLYVVSFFCNLLRPLSAFLLGKYMDGPDSSVFTVLKWVWFGQSLLVFASIICMTIAVRAWSRTPIAATLLLLINLASGWIPYFGDWLHQFMFRHEVLRGFYWIFREAGQGVVLCWILWRLPPAVPDPRVAAGGLRIAGGAIIARVLVVVLLALMTMGMVKGETAAKAMTIVAPALVILSLAACAWGLLRTEAWAPVGFPRIRMTIGAALVAWWAGVQMGLLEELMQSWRSETSIDMWMYAGPFVAAIGFLLVGLAIADFASQRGDAALQSAATSRTAIIIVLSVVGIGVQYMFAKATTSSSALALGVMAALANVGALVIMSTLLFQASTTMEDSGLPQARLRTP